MLTENPRKTKACVMCCELIDSGAKKCFHCSSIQTKWANVDGNPWVLSIFAILLLLFFASQFRSVFWQPTFEDYAQQLTTETSRFDFTEATDGKSVSCLGLIHNTSQHDWTSFKFEARLYDAKNELIDTFSSSDNSLLVLTNSRTNFRIRGIPALPESEYRKCEIQIKQALLDRK